VSCGALLLMMANVLAEIGLPGMFEGVTDARELVAIFDDDVGF